VIWAGILLKLAAFQIGLRWPVVSLAAFAVSLLIDVRQFGPRGIRKGVPVGQAVRDIAAVNLGSGLLAVFLGHVAEFIMVRHAEGIPAMAACLRVLLNAIRLPVSSFAGSLFLSTMAGSMEFPVTYDLLGLRTALLLAATVLVYLLHLKESGRQVLAGALVCGAVAVAAALLRAAFSIGVFLFACYFLDHESAELPVRPFRDPDLVALSFLPFLLMFLPVLRAVGVFVPDRPREARPSRRCLVAYGAFAVLLAAVFWEPVGIPKQGALLISTFHTKWSRTDRAYDKEWFGSASGYNYYSLKKYLEVFHDVRELTARLSDEALEGVSVLLVYDPDRPFAPEEIEAVRKFVKRGGGLLLIGDHTNVFGSAAHLNELCRPFGFQYRDDVLFDQTADFFQILFPGKGSSFLLKGIDVFKFRGPCSIRPESLFTSTVMEIPHSKSLRAIYSVNNFYPRPADNPAMKTGRFAVAVTAHYGLGRVFAFGDSTIFSQFELFCPGKYELLANVTGWLDRRDRFQQSILRRIAGAASAILILLLVLRSGHPRTAFRHAAVAIVLFYAARGGTLIARKSAAELPEVRTPARFVHFAVDQADDRFALDTFTGTADFARKYDIFIQWAFRNGMFPAFYLRGAGHSRYLFDHLQESGRASAGMTFILQDEKDLQNLAGMDPDLFRRQSRFLFLLGSGLQPEKLGEALSLLGAPGGAELARARPIDGLDNVRTITAQGRKYVVVLSAERFSDKEMGYSEKVVPNQQQKDRYEREFRILEELFANP
jgi:hypothetical protein